MTDPEVQRINPKTAAAILDDDRAILIDVRSKVEFDYVGHPIGAVHVVWKEFPGWDENSRFVEEVRAALSQRGGDDTDRPLLFICRSGARSMAAARKLGAAGYTRLYNVEEGFEGDKDGRAHRGNIGGWRFHGLPWEQT